ncbi:MAG: TraR/DksA C4-type zinc finger protein [Pirellulales bacterium]|nr:TraR/DksA C4-type zinc finger protein [Pirellulales bacterium]
MNGNKHLALRSRLEALQARLRPEVGNLTEQTLKASGGQAAQELSNAPFHLGDGGTEEYLHDLNATLLENQEYLTNEVQAALRRMTEGSYGKCEACGRDIAAVRLEAIPYTRFCIKCADSAGSAPDVNLNKGRPHTPQDTLSPEGEMGEDRDRFRDGGLEEVDVESDRPHIHRDVHAAGTLGGGGATGGLAGSNEGHGEPNISELQDAMGSSNFDVEDARNNDPDEPRAGRSGGAVGGTPANKRAR